MKGCDPGLGAFEYSNLATVPGGRSMGQLPKPLKAHLLIPSAVQVSQGCRLGGSQLQLRFPKRVSIQGLLRSSQHQTLHKVLRARMPLPNSVKSVTLSVLCSALCSAVLTLSMCMTDSVQLERGFQGKIAPTQKRNGDPVQGS